MDMNEALSEVAGTEVKKIGGIDAAKYLKLKSTVLKAGVPEAVFYRKPGAVLGGVIDFVASQSTHSE
jgi:hypothetical protein